MGYVYMIQSEELNGTNKVKIGMSTCENNSRIKSYGKNAKTIIKYNCSYPYMLERCLIKQFKKNYNLFKGNEWFEGDIEEMKKLFNKVINNENEYLSRENMNIKYWRKYAPYLFRHINDNDCYILNRDYEYIGYNTKDIKDVCPEAKTQRTQCKIDDEYLFNDGTKPWNNEKNFSIYKNKFEKLIKNKNCLNMNENTLKIFNS